MNKKDLAAFFNSINVVQKCISDSGMSVPPIVFASDRSATDGHTVWLKVSKNETMFSSLLHENGHLKFTDFNVFQRTGISPALMQAFNVIEDIRIDQLIQENFEGGFYIYKKGHLDLIKTFETISPSGELGDVYLYTLLLGLRNGGHQVHFALKNVSTFVTPEIAKVCERYAVSAVNADSSAKAMILAADFLKALGQTQDDAQASDGSDDAQASDGTDDAQASDGTDDAQASDGSNDAQATDGSFSYQFSESAPSLDFDGKEFDKGRLLDDVDKTRVKPEVIKLLNNWKQVDTDLDNSGLTNLINPSYARNITMSLKAPLRALQQQRNKIRSGMSEFGNSIDSDSIIAASLGERQVFRTDSRRKKANLAVSVLTDMSSSMDGIKSIHAATASYGLINSLESVDGIATELLIYGSRGKVKLIKSFKQKASHANFAWPLLGGTHTGLAMNAALFRMADRTEEKKVLFVITDGDSDAEEIERSIDLANTMNITVIAIGIQVKSMAGFADVKRIQINNPAELAKQFKEQLKQFI